MQPHTRKTRRAAIFAFKTKNLGDDVQSYAALHHFDAVSAFVDRDRLDATGLSEPHVTLLNSWFKRNPVRGKPGTLYHDIARRLGLVHYGVPDAGVDPIAFGFFLGRPEILDHGWWDYLRQLAPIGCRNEFTSNLLADAGIDAHVTGCLTMYLGRMFEQPAQRSGIVFIDLDPDTEKTFVPAELSRQAIRISNYAAPSVIGDPWLRFAHVAQNIERIRTAELVVSRRLHGALPSLGLGTPVIALPDPGIDRARERAEGFHDLFQVVYQDETDRASQIDWSVKSNNAIPDTLEQRYAELCQRLDHKQDSSRGLYRRAIGSGCIRIVNPGIGTRPRRIYFKMGRNVSERKVQSWSDREIGLDIPYFAGIEKLDATVLFKPKLAEPREMGSLSNLLIRQELRSS